MDCRFCAKNIEQSGSLAAHEKSCERNPNRVVRSRSPDAGVKKGTPSPLRGRKMGTKYREIWKGKIPDEQIFIENSKTTRKVARNRILNFNLLEYRCQICGVGPEWNGQPMPLILDHINGKNDDHRLENLRFVCSNCDTQLDTYKAKNKNRIGKSTGDENGLENRRA